MSCGGVDAPTPRAEEPAELVSETAFDWTQDPAPAAQFFVEDAPAPEPTQSETCATQSVPLRSERRPVDVILVLDNSASMDSEIAAVERNINVNFAAILEASGADYRVILLSRHRQRDRFQTSDDATAICVTRPLSNLKNCPWLSPVASERFFHYSTSIGSSTSLRQALATYDAPDEAFSTTDVGWSEWLRPNSKKVFLEVTDDDSTTSADAFVRGLSALSSEHFGSDTAPNFVFHSIVGLHSKAVSEASYAADEPLVSEVCESPQSDVVNAGLVYQRLSRLTGGLRYPLCELEGYDVVFRNIAEDVLVRSGVSCSLPLPAAPPGQRLDLDHAEVFYSGAESETVSLGQVPTPASCADGAFYVLDGRLELCPTTCESLGQIPSASISLTFDCNAFVDLR